MLKETDVVAKIADVVDNNDIDREVTQFKPNIVIIEALWVIPSKFNILVKLHPTVRWVIRLHSEIPFLANEGIAFEWLFDYCKFYPRVQIGTNSKHIEQELSHLLNLPIAYLPNFYPVDFSYKGTRKEDKDVINVGCFGAIRPLKNQLLQAIASIKFAESLNKKLRFYVNMTRIECKGEPVETNLIGLFKNSKHELVGISWLDYDKFIEFIRKNIDIGVQVSFTETFNIVSADMVNANLPIVTSSEVDWVLPMFYAKANSVNDIKNTLLFAWRSRIIHLQYLNKYNLWRTSKSAETDWKKFLDVK
jgi:glycosyltransferase involved in cell wall biosynthesis